MKVGDKVFLIWGDNVEDVGEIIEVGRSNMLINIRAHRYPNDIHCVSKHLIVEVLTDEEYELRKLILSL